MGVQDYSGTPKGSAVMTALPRQAQHRRAAINDQLDAAQVAEIASMPTTETAQRMWDSVLSQLKRILHGDEAGTAFADPTKLGDSEQDGSLLGLINASVHGHTAFNKGMVAKETFANGDLACANPMQRTPTQNGYVAVFVNGVLQSVGDGVKDGSCYFSADGGVTAKAISDIELGDLLYWMGTTASYQLTSDDRVDFHYESA